MLNRKHNPVATLFVLLTLVGVSKPVKALLIAQNEGVTTSVLEDSLSEKLFTSSSNSNSAIAERTNSITARDFVTSNADDNSGTVVGDTNLEDSGTVNLELKDSGLVNIDLRDSGQINFDPKGSGEIDANGFTDGSGTVNPELEDSGSIAPDLEDSGQTISYIELEAQPTIIADVDNNSIADEVEEGETANEERGWWWWLPLIIGIPIVAAIIVSTIGRSKSDREPAVSNVGDLNATDDEIGGSGSSNRENLSVVGANVGNAERLDNTVNNSATSIGAATLAEGNTFTGDRNRTENVIDSDIEQVNLEDEDTDIVAEIPSTSVSEFTGYETKLQTGDSSTELQDDDTDFESLDEIPPINPHSDVAASELVADLDLEERTSDLAIEETVIDLRTDTNTSESSDNLTIDTGDRNLEETTDDFERKTADNGSEVKEFRGDYVLQEETEGFTPYQRLDESNLDTELAEVGNDAIANEILDETTVIVDSAEPNLTVDVDSESNIAELQPDIDNEPIADEESIQTVGLVSDRAESSDDTTLQEVTTPERSISEVEARPLSDTELAEAENDAIANQIVDETTVIEVDSSQQDSLVDVDSQPDIAELQPDLDDEIANEETIEIIGFDRNPDLEPLQTDLEEDLDRSNELPEIDNEGVVSPEQISDRNLNSELETVDVSLDEIGFDDRDETIEVKSNEISFNEISETSIDRITLDDLEPDTTSLDSTPTTDAELDEISFDENSETNLEQIALNDSELDEISLDETEDLELDQITLDDLELDTTSLDSTPTTDVELDEISFDETEDLKLNEISFDDSELNNISFESSSTIDSELDEMSFDETEDLKLDEISFDDSEDDLNNIDDSNTSDEISYEDLDKAGANLTLDLLSNNTAGIDSLSEDESEDMNNITEWLESLETPNQSTDDILEWLDGLNTNEDNSIQNDSDIQEESEDTDDITFQFIEDLERENRDRDNK